MKPKAINQLDRAALAHVEPDEMRGAYNSTIYLNHLAVMKGGRCARSQADHHRSRARDGTLG